MGVSITVGTVGRASLRVTDAAESQTATMIDLREGSTARLTATFEDETGERTDPDAVRFVVDAPDETTATFTLGDDEGIVRDSVGRFHCDLEVGVEGYWTCRAEGDGAVDGVAFGNFRVRPAP